MIEKPFPAMASARHHASRAIGARALLPRQRLLVARCMAKTSILAIMTEVLDLFPAAPPFRLTVDAAY